IHEAQTTKLLIVAPATADILAKFAHGLADDFLSTMFLATTAPVIVAPAMNVNMWEHPATRTNVETLRARGVKVIEPGSGNRASGRMGYAIAESARQRGARVILISAPTGLPSPAGVEVVRVVTADEMRSAVLKRLREATIVIMAAAVSDYRVRSVAAQKIKREAARAVILELEATEDILREVMAQRVVGTIVVGFAAETENALANGRVKLAGKGVDAVVVNDVSVEGIGFDAEQNAGSFLTRGAEVELPMMSKSK